MRIPIPPPALHELTANMAQNSGKLLTAIELVASGTVRADIDGVYRHWDTLRHVNVPAGVDIDHETWWLAIKIARQGQRREIPLRTTANRPMWLSFSDLFIPYLRQIDQLAAGNMQGPPELRNAETRDRYLFRSLSEEAITSSQLEGASTTYDVAREMLRTNRPARSRGEHMIMNNFLAMQRVRELTSENLTPSLIFELHRIVTNGTLNDPAEAGRFRLDSDDIVVKDESDNILHRPPHASELSTRLNALCDFANETSAPFMHPVVQSILIHFWLAYDHPFTDGNGRTARLLFYWNMLRHGYWLTEYLSISRELRIAPAKYARAYLYVETDEHDVTYFILNQLHIVQRSIQTLLDYLRSKDQQLTQSIQRLRHIRVNNKPLNHRQHALLMHAMKHPFFRYTINSHQTSHGISYLTARSDLQSLADAGLLSTEKVGKAIHFIAPPIK